MKRDFTYQEADLENQPIDQESIDDKEINELHYLKEVYLVGIDLFGQSSRKQYYSIVHWNKFGPVENALPRCCCPAVPVQTIQAQTIAQTIDNERMHDTCCLITNQYTFILICSCETTCS